MIERYTRPEMGRLWSAEYKFECWWRVEREVCRVQYERGLIPREDWAAIEQRAAFSAARIQAIEAEVKHDVIAFLSDVAEQVGPAARHIHRGMTSSDLLDTALALQLGAAGELIERQLAELIAIMTEKARQYRHQLMIGRTHGVHAEPISFGLKFLLWREELRRHQTRLALTLRDVRVGKISGAVGTYQHIDPEVEQRVCANLGLTAAPISNQIVQRDRHAFWLATLALIGASLEKIATEIRHLQRTEVLEAEEAFTSGQKGSSAMPHKRNPILSERICGMARLLRGYALTALENVALWHERDISHSSAERVLLPDSSIVLDFMLAESLKLIRQLKVYPENMRRNLELTGGLIFSQELLLALVAKGMSREQAYALVQKNAMAAWQTDKDFQGLILADPDIAACLDYAEIAALFDVTKVLKKIDAIYQKLGE